MRALKQAPAGQMGLGGFGLGNMVSLDGGKRLRLDDKVDFWPATGRWRAIEGEHSGHGVGPMLEFLKAERERAGVPVRLAQPLASERSVACKYCRRDAELHGGLAVYPDRKDLADRRFWVCWPCNAWVGCHADTDKPLGDLADESLRDARIAAHAAFDPVWKEGRLSRPDAYAWLSQAMRIPRERCHIGMMELEECRQVGQLVYERFGTLSTSA